MFGTVCAFSVVGQTFSIKTFAGGGLAANSPLSVAIGVARAVAVDGVGNIFATSPAYSGVVRLDAQSGTLSLLAGNGIVGFAGDSGPAQAAQLSLAINYGSSEKSWVDSGSGSFPSE
jgi:hypothetical protein